MIVRIFGLVGILSVLLVNPAAAQNLKPVLRLEAGGPTSNVTALAFSPDGNTLYAGGFDKVVRVWRINAQSKRFELDTATSFRVPIHPGTQGAINAMALSSDGQWIAVGGLGVFRGGTDFGSEGKLWPAVGALKPEMREDQGLVYVFHTQKRETRILRGHTGPILSLAFAPSADKQPLLLASAARGWDTDAGKFVGEIALWDVDQSKRLAQRADLPAPVHNRPGLVAFATGKQAGVAIAWGDMQKSDDGSFGFLRIWDVGQNKLQSFKDGYENLSLALLPDAKGLLTASFKGQKRQLQLWQLDGANATAGKNVNFPNPPEKFLFPRHIALFAGRVEGTQDHVAVTLRQGRDASLELIDLSEANFGKSKVEVPLWTNSAQEPIVVSSPRGRFLAVAGYPDHAIKVYFITSLLNNQVEPQILESVGTTYRYVRFVDKAGKPGLVLNKSELRPKEGGFQAGDRVFDFSARDVVDPKGWSLASPKQGDWKPQVKVEQGRPVISLTEQGQAKGTPITFAAGVRLDAVSFLAPQAPWNVPLLAAGFYHETKGEVGLDIYNGDSGERIRRFAGHLAAIRSIAFSADGKLVASVSDDQTVNVWSLTDLPEIFGKNGGLGDTAVEKKNNALVVAEVDASRPGAQAFKVGQTIQGFVDDKGELKALDSAHAFYQTLWQTKPGTVRTFRVQGADVKVAVGQGTDARKPLFSLFITRADKDGFQEWLGWNATGPFDSSQKEVERYLGWHFNTGDAKEPARFAQMNEYRKEYYKKDLLKHLVAQASLAKGLDAQDKEANPPKQLREVPRLQDGIGAVRAPNGDLVYRNRQDSVQFSIHQFDLQEGDVIDWQLDDGPAKIAGAPEGNTWSIPLADLPNKPGRYKVKLNLHLRDSNQQVVDYSRAVMVRYQLPAPQVSLAAPEKQRAARKAEFEFDAKVVGTAPDQKVVMKLEHKVQGKVVATETIKATLGLDKAFDFKKPLTLQEGTNLVELVAENVDALATFEAEERGTTSLDVQYNPKAPSILVQEVITLLPDKISGPSFAVQPGQPLWVESTRVRITGTIQADENVQPPEWDLGPETKRTTVAVKDGKEVPFAFDVDLQPGEQKVRVFARTAQSKEVTETLTLGYRPPLPRVVITAPVRDAKIQGKDDQYDVILQAKLLQPRGASPKAFKLKVHYLVNGKKVDVAEIDSTAATIPDRKLTVKPGNNVFQVRIESPWTSDAQPPEMTVRYVRPPQILAVRSQLVGKDPFVNLTADIASPLPPLEKSVAVEVNGKPARFAKVSVAKGKDKMWTVQVDEVPLEVDESQAINKNGLTLYIANAEDQALKSDEVAVVYNTPPPPRPEIVLEASESTQKEPEIGFKFQVKSRKPLKRVEVSLGDKVLFAPQNLDQLKPNAQGVYEFDTNVLPIEWGINRLKVEAVNDGGPASAPMVVTVPPWPVQVDIDQVSIEEGRQENVAAASDSTGKISFPKVSDGRVTLHGKVRWSSKDDSQLKGTHYVKLYVNGFQQLPVTLLPAVKGERVRKFEAPLSLPGSDNQVEVLLPDLKSDASNRRDFTIACAKPQRGQQVHVVIVAPGETDDKDLKDKFRMAFTNSKQGQDLFKAGIFDSIRIHPPLTDYVAPLEVLTRLDNIASTLKSRAARGFANDLVLVYYWGKQSEQQGQNYFWTSETEPGALASSSLGLNRLKERYFDRFAGAQVLMLDLYPDKQGSKTSIPWQSDYRFSILGMMSEIKPSFRYPLLSGLEKSLPTSTYLDDLQKGLNKGMGNGGFQGHVPPTLRVQLNATPTSGQ